MAEGARNWRSAGISGFRSPMDSTGVRKSDLPASRYPAAETAALPVAAMSSSPPNSPVRTPALQPGGVKPPLHKPWTLPPHGLAVFHGAGNVARLSHYFLPRLLLEGKRVLFLDGANSADPRLLERFARERNVPFAEFNRGIQIARAFTCFQLTELIARVPRFLSNFPAEVVIVTAFPDLYFDEDVRDWDARVAFEQGLRNLSHVAPVLAVFSAIEDFAPPPARRPFFPKLCAAASESWRFSLDAENRLRLTCTQQALKKLSH